MTEVNEIKKIILSCPKEGHEAYPTQVQMRYLGGINKIFQIGVYEYTIGIKKGTEQLYLKRKRL